MNIRKSYGVLCLCKAWKWNINQTFALNCLCCWIESAPGEVVLGEDGKPIEGAVPPQIGEDGQPIVADSAEAAAPVPEPEVNETHLNVQNSRKSWQDIMYGIVEHNCLIFGGYFWCIASKAKRSTTTIWIPIGLATRRCWSAICKELFTTTTIATRARTSASSRERWRWTTERSHDNKICVENDWKSFWLKYHGSLVSLAKNVFDHFPKWCFLTNDL